MLSILAITFPFFVLVLCGDLAVRRAPLPLAAIGGWSSVALYFALPCMPVFGGRQLAGVRLAAISAPKACAAPG